MPADAGGRSSDTRDRSSLTNFTINDRELFHRKDSIDNWDLAIDVLESWKVLLPDAVSLFRKLRDIRNQAVHFDPEVDRSHRELSLSAAKTFADIIEKQFAGFGTLPWYIPHIRGATFVRKASENEPFVKRIVLPNCSLVGHLHQLDTSDDGWIVLDHHAYEDREITDEEFCELFNNQRG